MDIYIIKTKDSDKIPQEVLRNYQQKKISNQKQLHIHCFAYYMLEKILSEKYQIFDTKIIYEGNKPVLENKAKSFSISHSGEYIAIGFSDFNCGIDIEKIKPRNYEKISKRMHFVCDDLEGFYKAWTLYEASYKLGNKKNDFAQLSFCNNGYYISAVCENFDEEFNIG